ncbi:MAG: hypothetical protein HY699_06890 [Deltaproteobacteria bacterium]|nr:hypothetical protein [Deltaproteobacteria bacterium]
MNDRSPALVLIAVALAGYGVYIGGYLPAMLVGQPVPLLLIGFVLQVVCALAAAVGVWRRWPWAGGAVVLLGASIAATWLIEGFALGIVAYLHALLVAVLAIVVALVIAAYVKRQHGPRIDWSRCAREGDPRVEPRA